MRLIASLSTTFVIRNLISERTSNRTLHLLCVVASSWLSRPWRFNLFLRSVIACAYLLSWPFLCKGGSKTAEVQRGRQRQLIDGTLDPLIEYFLINLTCLDKYLLMELIARPCPLSKMLTLPYSHWFASELSLESFDKCVRSSGWCHIEVCRSFVWLTLDAYMCS